MLWFFVLAGVTCGLFEVPCEAQLAAAVGQSAGLAFMNITPDTREVGFFQIFAVTPNMSTIHLESVTGLNQFDVITTSQSQFFNGTFDYSQLKVVNATTVGKSYLSQLGLILSSSTTDVRVYGVKSDRGTVDGFLALPLTVQSTQFFIASWQCVSQEFFAAVQVISVLADTCVEVYRIVNGTKFVRTQSQYLDQPYDVFLYSANVNEDLTGYYVNTSKPVSVLSGHSCAFIPNNVYFCDHIVEQIPPVSELGLVHIVPPIVGRADGAGFIVRVVATDLSTSVSWMSATGQVSGQTVLTRGQFVQITNPHAAEAMKVTCDKPCLVMQYNTGRQNAPRGIDDKPTDPFMMNIAPVERFDQQAAFATASFCQVISSVTYKVDFNNYVAIIASSSDINFVLFDGHIISSIASWYNVPSWGFSIAVFAVSHGAHVVTTSVGSKALIGVYSYGHSPLDSSSGAYGYTAAFRVHGNLLSTLWQESEKLLTQQIEDGQAATCEQETIRSGSTVAQHPVPTSPQVVSYPFTLDVTVSTVGQISASCSELYRAALTTDLQVVSRRVNFLICTMMMCSTLIGPQGSGAPINSSTVSAHIYSRQQVVYAAINTHQLADPVTFDIVQSTGAISTIHVVVPFIGIMDTTSDSFAACRVEVREYLRQFVNWAGAEQLIADIEGCPHIQFYAPFEFSLRQTICPAAL